MLYVIGFLLFCAGVLCGVMAYDIILDGKYGRDRDFAMILLLEKMLSKKREEDE